MYKEFSFDGADLLSVPLIILLLHWLGLSPFA